MLGGEDLISRIENGTILRSALDTKQAVDAGDKNDEDCGADGFDDDGAAAAFDAIEGEDDELSERRLEEEKEDQRHLGEDHRVKELDHRCRCEQTLDRREVRRTCCCC